MAKKGQKQKERRVANNKKQTRPSSEASGKASSSDKASSGGHRGLVNLGNTCFLNSILQCLNVSIPFAEEFMELAQDSLANGTIGVSLCNVFRGIRGQESSKGAVSPKPLLDSLRKRFPFFRANEQQDAHELLLYLLGTISGEATKDEKKRANEGKAPPKPPGEATGICDKTIQNNFGFRESVATLCWGCGRVSLRLGPLQDISVELPRTGELPGLLGMPSSALRPLKAAGSSTSKGALTEKPGTEQAAEDIVKAEGESRCQSKQCSDEQKTEQQLEQEAARFAARLCALQLTSKATGSADLENLTASKPGALRKMAKGLGVTEGELEETDDLSDTKEARLRLIISTLWPKESSIVEVTETVPDSEAPAASEPFEVVLSRETSSKDVVRWGFEWNRKQIEKDSLILDGVVPDSILDNWNLKRRTLGQASVIVSKGDKLVAANGHDSIREMQKVLKEAQKVTLTFVHEANDSKNIVTDDDPSCKSSKKNKQKKKARDDKSSSDEKEDASSKQKALEEKEARRLLFCEQAQKRSEELPKALRTIFSAGCSHEQEASTMAKPESSHKGSKDLALADCLQHYCSVEALVNNYEPSYECETCCKETKDKQLRRFASKRVWFWSPPPPLLTVHLKRFTHGSRSHKLSTTVETPAVLDLTPFMMTEAEHSCLQPHLAADSVREPPNKIGHARYELYGVCVHLGTTMERGHYIAYVNAGPSLEQEVYILSSYTPKKWYNISDSHVSKCTRQEALQAEAYVAFYRREGLVAKVAASTPDDGQEKDSEGGCETSSDDGGENTGD